MTTTRQRLKYAGLDIDALREAERTIAKYERAFRRIWRLVKDPTTYSCEHLDKIEAIMERVYPPKQRKAREAGKVK
jgi:hypothetical protein